LLFNDLVLAGSFVPEPARLFVRAGFKRLVEYFFLGLEVGEQLDC
jgi:hypothetical protein